MNRKAKKKLSGLLTVICLGVFSYAAYGLITTYLDYSNNNKRLSGLQQAFYEAGGTEASQAYTGLEVRSGFDALLKDNNELVGWLTVDGTKIDYPILKGEDNNDYLRHDFYKDYNILGSIFMDFRNNIIDFDRNTIIYGHRTKDGSMFEGLTKFQDKEFYEENPTFTFETLFESYEAEIFAAYNTTTDFNYIQTEFSSDEEYAQLLEEINKHSFYDTGVEVGTGDRILTLSTCDYELDNYTGRFVVHAKLVKKT